MSIYRVLNQFLAAILIMIYHLFVGKFVDRTSMAFIMSMYIFVLTMIKLVGLPIDEDTGHIEESEEPFTKKFDF